jgi:nitroreductase
MEQGAMSMDLMDVILQRRSIRKYKNDDIPHDMLDQVLEAARWAPSWANTQCWEFVIVKDGELKERLRDTLTPWNPARNAMVQAPVVLAACGKRGVAGYRRGEQVTIRGDWLLFDVALALHNLSLSAYSLGLGTVHVGAFDAVKAAEIIDVPTGIEVVELMPIGYPDESPGSPPRKEISSFVYSNKYGTEYNSNIKMEKSK